ncbi:acyl-CoA dehydrogenase, middle domain protein [Mycobacterium xenopi 4042]|uniref:Acyl-CoA dehydrogenase, middle domain protein n=1 Tax=Mycobacterium xenopi 4042 TaxID=1299334 RepID=X8AHC9_MYCXE|nr:acyl-CoA dehydrogenase, middle domain protein [Mycobacterium xenopi 4042]
MQLTFDAEVEAFRAEFAAFLDEHVPTPPGRRAAALLLTHPGVGAKLAAPVVRSRVVVAGQPAGVRWPQRDGFAAVCARRRIVTAANPSEFQSAGCRHRRGIGSVVRHPEQKRRWAVPILRAEMTASLGMSEPGAGSDLASLRTRAVLDGDHFVVSGQKVWTSGAHDADVLLTFVRTDPDAPKHRGISALLIPTDTPGVVRRPFATACDPSDVDFNEVFFTEVRVPAENLVGR